MFDKLEKPLPKPTSEDYIMARLLESMLEATLALEFLNRGLLRNAAGKVFQAWRAMLAALLRLELERLKGIAKTDEERRWLESSAVPRVPTTRMKELSRLLEGVGYNNISLWTDRALNLHDYQYHGPDPDMALSKYRSPQEAAYDILKMIEGINGYIETLKARVKWSDELELSWTRLKEELTKAKTSLMG